MNQNERQRLVVARSAFPFCYSGRPSLEAPVELPGEAHKLHVRSFHSRNEHPEVDDSSAHSFVDITGEEPSGSSRVEFSEGIKTASAEIGDGIGHVGTQPHSVAGRTTTAVCTQS